MQRLSIQSRSYLYIQTIPSNELSSPFAIDVVHIRRIDRCAKTETEIAWAAQHSKCNIFHPTHNTAQHKKVK
jgi:hypothetical protein